MKKSVLFLISICLIPALVFAEGAILVEIPPLSGRTTLSDQLQQHQFQNADQFRTVRRVGIGAGFAGTLGLVGLILDFNIQPENSIKLGFGTSSNYNTFSAGYRKYLTDSAFSPYFSVDYSYWYSAPGRKSGFETSNPGFLSSKWLDENQKAGGPFAISVVSPTVGLSFFSLEGETKGTSVFAEISFLMNVQRPQPIPQGGVGTVFYF